MSTESVRQFLSAVSSDSALQEKLVAVTDSVNFVKIAQESGYSFTLEDLQTYIAQHNDGELSENELEAVAGGRRDGSNISLFCNFKVFAEGSLSTQGWNYAPGGNGNIPSPQPGPKPGGVEL
jgi:predicted ribosomally synthesized peptide with nif11-like leader